jgi:RsiW-degrading membrane proteinase PrsW (M82 family)
MLKEWPVLRVLLFVMALHATWNSPLTVPLVGDLLGFLLKSLILGVIGWLLVLMLIQSGLGQVKNAAVTEGPADNQA